MSDNSLSYTELIKLISELAENSLQLWELPNDSKVKLINVSENFTFLVEASNGFRSILRVHRENYHTRNAILCEHAWAKDLNDNGGVITPGIIKVRDGQNIQSATINGLYSERFLVMFEYVDGKEPIQQGDLVGPFEELGEIAALTHLNSISWE